MTTGDGKVQRGRPRGPDNRPLARVGGGQDAPAARPVTERLDEAAVPRIQTEPAAPAPAPITAEGGRLEVVIPGDLEGWEATISAPGGAPLPAEPHVHAEPHAPAPAPAPAPAAGRPNPLQRLQKLFTDARDRGGEILNGKNGKAIKIAGALGGVAIGSYGTYEFFQGLQKDEVTEERDVGRMVKGGVLAVGGFTAAVLAGRAAYTHGAARGA